METQRQALELWRQSLVASVRSDAPDLSARQMALLLSVFLDDGPHTVRGLAKALNISKPAVSRALDRLSELGYIRRQRDEMDRRNVLVQRQTAGGVFLKSFAANILGAHADILARPAFPLEQPSFVEETEAVSAATASAPSAPAASSASSASPTSSVASAESSAPEAPWADVAA